MGNERKEIYEKKDAWARRRMQKNAEIESLNEEQHNALAWLCNRRHELHKNWEHVWNGDFDTLEAFDNSCGPCEAENILADVELPNLNLNFDAAELPLADDFYNLLSDDEQTEWEEKAEEYNENHPNVMQHSGSSLWREESGVYEEFANCLDNLNNQIEKYLAEIDKQYGTDYCPSGYTRLL